MAKDDLKRDLWIVVISLAVGFAIGFNWDFLVDKFQHFRSLFSDTGWN